MQHRAGFYEKYVKRLLDLVLSGMALIILSPLLLVTAILVRVKLGSPVIFCQERPGKDEKIFERRPGRERQSAAGRGAPDGLRKEAAFAEHRRAAGAVGYLPGQDEHRRPEAAAGEVSAPLQRGAASPPRCPPRPYRLGAGAWPEPCLVGGEVCV